MREPSTTVLQLRHSRRPTVDAVCAVGGGEVCAHRLHVVDAIMTLAFQTNFQVQH